MVFRYNETIINLEQKLKEKRQQVEEMKSKFQLHDSCGPCTSSLDVTLTKLGVERQAYYGRFREDILGRVIFVLAR